MGRIVEITSKTNDISGTSFISSVWAIMELWATHLSWAKFILQFWIGYVDSSRRTVILESRKAPSSVSAAHAVAGLLAAIIRRIHRPFLHRRVTKPFLSLIEYEEDSHLQSVQNNSFLKVLN
ncbi:unnamed protein product [Lactuca virosa]|uniref:Uncharacterized protein n=1 Tax=Lactuca virosa TaxID=75947 RepID=A0AAU9M5P8_9ASTR|nr:unnamed protein product [Lactuca virosa]